jgi:hypothetical protein
MRRGIGDDDADSEHPGTFHAHQLKADAGRARVRYSVGDEFGRDRLGVPAEGTVISTV